MPKPTTRQTHMPVHMGNAPSVEADTRQIDNMAFKVNVVPKVADYTVKATESGTFFTNAGATAAVNFTLPAFADGLVYFFFVAADFAVTVTSSTADMMITDHDVAADSIALSTTSEMLGGMIQVFSDGTKWMSMVYAEESVAVTVVTA